MLEREIAISTSCKDWEFLIFLKSALKETTNILHPRLTYSSKGAMCMLKRKISFSHFFISSINKSWLFYILYGLLQGDILIKGQGSKLATNKKSTVFLQKSCNVVNIIFSWNGNIDQDSWYMKKNCWFFLSKANFTPCPILTVSPCIG